MKIIQLNDDGNVKLFCPFCGKKVIDPEQEFDECEHTLFVATNEGGFEFISPKIEINEEFDQPNDLSEDLSDEADEESEALAESEEELTLNEYIETLEYPEAICFEIAQFSGFSAFVGFGREL